VRTERCLRHDREVSGRVHGASSCRDLRWWMRVHFICAGNICRSALAVRLFGQRTKVSALRLPLASSGLVADPDDAVPNKLTLRAAADAGIDLAGHRATRFDPSTVAAGDLVLVMERQQAETVRAATAERGLAAESVRLLGSFAGGWGDEIPDPEGAVFSDYERTVLHVRASIEGLLAWLASTAERGRPIR
jgi:protein-tyrosine-phosphatase